MNRIKMNASTVGHISTKIRFALIGKTIKEIEFCRDNNTYAQDTEPFSGFRLHFTDGSVFDFYQDTSPFGTEEEHRHNHLDLELIEYDP